ncbi:hypothetical protein PR001_g8059 [Phytophthora rubi]|uniref:Uncharacterized protein n=1 Tax=Phytophthora rubi TaxID=129364 RepID=A0A6A3NA81_9STRA|nr:hypothetical protein PR001_g8059 [Phytophthora rubi]
MSEPSPPAVARGPKAPVAEAKEEMPLLFMDELPPNFQQSAQLAAIATFMADSDDEEDDEEEASRAGNSGKQRRQRLQKSASTRRRQKPYARSLTKTTDPKTKKNRDSSSSRSGDTKELQLFLSMFHVS